jgi:uncharacterized membrane protein
MSALQVINLVLAAMMTGGLVMVLLAVIPTFHRLPDDLAVQLHREVDHYIDVPLPIFTVLTVLTAIPLLFASGLTSLSQVLIGVAAGASVVVAVSSHLINRPMNQRLRGWGDRVDAAEYAELRRRWDLAHGWRTFAGLVALICLIIALIHS